MTTVRGVLHGQLCPGPDRCALLTRSLNALAPSVEHYIVVDRADRPQFASLENSRTTVVTKEEILPLRLQRVNVRARAALRSVGAGARQADPRLARPAAREARGRREARRPTCSCTPTRTWCSCVRSSCLLGRRRRGEGAAVRAARRDRPRPAEARALAPERRAHPRDRTGRASAPGLHLGPHRLATSQRRRPPRTRRAHDRAPLAAHARGFLGRVRVHPLRPLRHRRARAGDGQFTASSLCHDYHTLAPLSAPALEAVLDGLGPDQFAVSITAKAGMNPADYAAAVERRWASNRA